MTAISLATDTNGRLPEANINVRKLSVLSSEQLFQVKSAVL